MKTAAVFFSGLLAAALVCALRTPSNPHQKSPLRSAQFAETQGSHVVQKPVLPAANAEKEQKVRLADGVALLERGIRWLESVPDYTATFFRHERVQATLRDPETTELKLRHEPFSVTLVWTADGKTAHYREGMNANRVAVRLGGWKRRLGWINLNPHGTRAMEQSRYAITDVGLMRLTEQLLGKFAPYVDAEGVQCAWLPDEAIGGRPCRVFHVDYASAAVNPEYRQSTVWLDHEWNVPLCVRNTDWEVDPENPEGLVELYVYENVRLDTRLTDRDFSVDAPVSTNVAAAAE